MSLGSRLMACSSNMQQGPHHLDTSHVCMGVCVCVQSPGWAALTPAPTLPQDSVFPACPALNYSSSHVSSALGWSMPGSEDPAGLGEGPVLMGTHPSVCPDDLLPWTG